MRKKICRLSLHWPLTQSVCVCACFVSLQSITICFYSFDGIQINAYSAFNYDAVHYSSFKYNFIHSFSSNPSSLLQYQSTASSVHSIKLSVKYHAGLFFVFHWFGKTSISIVFPMVLWSKWNLSEKKHEHTHKYKRLHVNKTKFKQQRSASI